MQEICIIPPAGEPIHIEEAKHNARIPGAEDDGRVSALTSAARQVAETETRQQLLHARWKLTSDRFPAHRIALPKSPLVRVVSIQYLDMAGETQTVPASDYVVDSVGTPGSVAPVFGKVWPPVLPQIGAVSITYDAGYASPIKVTAASRLFSVSGPVTWEVGARVQFYNSGGEDASLPAPLEADAAYLIDSSPSAGVYTITDEAGAPITFTSAGIGKGYIGIVPAAIRNWMLLHVAAGYDKEEMPEFASRLLDGYRTSLP